MSKHISSAERQLIYIDEIRRIAVKNPTQRITFDLFVNETTLPNTATNISAEQFEHLVKLSGFENHGMPVPAGVNKHLKPVVPDSEDIQKRIYTATEQDCVNDLKKLADATPDKVISRNFYRVNGSYAESVWSRYFGTFEEFKRQAGIKLTRQQHRLEKELAKHASVDHYRQMNGERTSYGEKYLRPAGGRHQLMLCASDLHDKEADTFALRVLLDTAKRAQPDIICLNGDVFDLPEFSKFTVDPRTWDVTGRIQFVHEQILHPLREACPNAQIDLIEGNHEYRLLRHLADGTPAIRALLADLHGMTVAQLLGLDKYEVNYVAKGDLAAFSSRDIKQAMAKNYKVYHNAFLAHHFPEGRNLGMPGFCGHHHKLETWAQQSAIFGAYNFWQVGSMHRPAATYTDGSAWSTGFLLNHMDTTTKQSCQEYIDIRNFCVVGGQYYFRGPGEI